jgi:hypothetical protein
MKRLTFISSVFWLMLAMGLVLALSLALAGCSVPTPAVTSAPVQITPTEQALATVRGNITYQGMPTPTSMLYLISAERFYSLEVPSASPASRFEMQVVPGTYQLIAFPTGSEDQEVRSAAAYSTGSGIAGLTIGAGQVLEGVRVQNINQLEPPETSRPSRL